MDLALFFKREGAASALVGTMLKESPEFRDLFFDALEDLEPSLVQSLKRKEWNVDVEVHQQDIRLVARDGPTVLIIENKIRAGAVQRNQMVKYYQRELTEPGLAPEKRIGLVYLAPGPSIGDREVERVRNAIKDKDRQRLDFAARVSWDEVKEAGDKIYHGSEAGDWQSHFIAEGLALVKNVIDTSPDEVWKAVGDRRIVKSMAIDVTEGLMRKFPKFQFGKPWPRKDGYNLWTQKTNVTMWLGLRFKPKAEAPYQPDDWNVKGGFKVKLVGALKLSAAGRRQPQLRERWEQKIKAGKLPVRDFQELETRASGWMTAEREIVGTKEDIVRIATEAGSGLMEVIRRFA